MACSSTTPSTPGAGSTAQTTTPTRCRHRDRIRSSMTAAHVPHGASARPAHPQVRVWRSRRAGVNA
jgi:hypothetical protein